MKVSYSAIIEKYDGPARAVISAEVLEMGEGETFNEETMMDVAECDYKTVAGHLRYADFFGHRVFTCIFNFAYRDKEISVSKYPCVTENV